MEQQIHYTSRNITLDRLKLNYLLMETAHKIKIVLLDGSVIFPDDYEVIPANHALYGHPYDCLVVDFKPGEGDSKDIPLTEILSITYYKA